MITYNLHKKNNRREIPGAGYITDFKVQKINISWLE